MSLEPPERPRLRDDVVLREVEGDYVVYEPVTDQTVLLNLSAAAVLELCDGSRTHEDIAREIAGTFSLPIEEARESIRGALEELAGAQLFERADPGDAETSTPR